MFAILKKSCNFANELSNQLKINDYEQNSNHNSNSNP